MQLAFRFGQPTTDLVQTSDGPAIDLMNPVLEGRAREPWCDELSQGRRCGSLTVWRRGPEVWGAAFVPLGESGHEPAARRLYADILRACGTLTLQRIWNFVPRINEHDGELENYRAFCKGRHQAFEKHFGNADERRMPAASAVGTGGDVLCGVFIAGTAAVRYVENPEQVPAYRYPSRYGPRSPSFARASLVQRNDGQRLYISGTASIRGSESHHPDDVAAQCELAIANMELVARAAGLGGLGSDASQSRAFRIYLREPALWPLVKPVFEARLCRPADPYTALQADICRRELLVELEACVDTGPAGAPGAPSRSVEAAQHQ